MRWVVNTTTRPLYAWERPDTQCTESWVGCRTDLDGCGKSLPTGIRSSDRPASDESLYKLRYPGPHEIYVYVVHKFGILFFSFIKYNLWAYGLDGPGIESRWGEIFRTSPDRPWGPPSLLYNGYQTFPGVKVLPGRDADPSPPSSAEV